ncbi:MAG: amidohydrolase family protein [Clostridia bacterium]|nr:amidohydrolase family protein [Clostridia bacterium]
MDRIDAHVHYALPLEPEKLMDLLERTGTRRAALVLVPHTKKLSCTPEALLAKSKYPDRLWVLTSLDPSNYYLFPKSFGKHMARYAARMRRIGCDGVKIIEGRPLMRRILPFPDFDAAPWEPFWAYAEKTELPILMHLNDPQEYWDAAQVSDYHKNRGDGYGPGDIHYEDQYAQLERVLMAHPKLKLCFAHFFFMSADLPRLGSFFDRFPNMTVDLTPGSEMYRILSQDYAEASAFFENYADRILYGTDTAARTIMAGHMEPFSEEENLRRPELVMKLLTPGLDEIHEPDGKYLIDVPAFRVRGLDISAQTREKILSGNFLRFIGGEPRPVDAGGVIRECRRLRLILKLMGLFTKALEPDPGDHAAVCRAFRQS